MQKIRVSVNRLIQHFDLQVATPHLVPQDFELHFRETITQASMDTKTERHVLARTGAIDDELVWILDMLLVAIAGDVPDNDLVAGFDLLAAQFEVLSRGT